MLGIISNTLRVATREQSWSGQDAAKEDAPVLPDHWRERETCLRKCVSERPKLFGK